MASSSMLKTLTILPSRNSTVSSKPLKPSNILFPSNFSRLPSLKSKHSFRDFDASELLDTVEGASGSFTEPSDRASVEPYKVAAGSEIPTEDDYIDKIKLMSLALGGGHSEFFLEALSTNVRKRVEVLQEIQRQHNELEANFWEERAALEAKYQKLYEPLYTKRYDIVNGVVEVEGVSGEAIVDKNDHIATEAKNNNKATKEKGVPNFWLTAMKTNEVLDDEIQERDEGALKYLKDIKWSRVEGLEGFKLEFYFDPNPYFKNTVLTKTYDMMEDEVTLDKAIGTEIEWFPGKNLTQMVLKKMPRKGSKNTKPVTKTEKCESFFNFFNPPQVPDDDETAEVLQGQMMQDYHVGEAIRDTIIPHAVSWFTGEALEIDEFEAFDEEGSEDYEDDEDEDVEDEDDAGEDDGNTKKN